MANKLVQAVDRVTGVGSGSTVVMSPEAEALQAIASALSRIAVVMEAAIDDEEE